MPDTTGDSQTTRIALDRLFVCLSHPTRRHVLMALGDDSPRTLEEFTAPEFNTEAKEWNLFKAELNRKHLPHLKRAGIIRWDRDSDTITRGPKFEDVRPLIRLINDHQDELPEDWSCLEID